jgi:hypothetical protein
MSCRLLQLRLPVLLFVKPLLLLLLLLWPSQFLLRVLLLLISTLLGLQACCAPHPSGHST